MPKSQISDQAWAEKLAEVSVNKQDLNRLLMDYLVVEGYREAAENFSKESGLAAVDLESIDLRMSIRHAIQSGDIASAIDRINDFNPEVLDNNPDLYFHLQQQRLIELIRQGSVAEALVFAQQELAPRGEEHPAFLADLERTMALLAFDIPATSMHGKGAEHALPAGLAALLHPAQRQRTATAVNAALLSSQSQSPSSKLPALLRMLAWGETLLSERVDFPAIELDSLLSTDAMASGEHAMTM